MALVGCVEIENMSVKVYSRRQLNVEMSSSAKGYIQDGLVAMWDGIENVGWGQHSDSAATWVDLKGTTNYNFILQNSYTWASNGLITSPTYDMVAETTSSIPYATNLTTEIVFETYAFPTTASRISFFKLGEALPFGNYHWAMRSLMFTNNGTGKIGWMFKTHSILSNTGYSNPPLNTPMSISTVYAVPSGSDDNKRKQNPTRVLFDGVAKSPSWASDGAAISGEMWISNNSANGFYGKVYAIRVYNRQLSNDEIGQNYAIDKQRFGI